MSAALLRADVTQIKQRAESNLGAFRVRLLEPVSNFEIVALEDFGQDSGKTEE